jgi:hypothetical protein
VPNHILDFAPGIEHEKGVFLRVLEYYSGSKFSCRFKKDVMLIAVDSFVSNYGPPPLIAFRSSFWTDDGRIVLALSIRLSGLGFT